MSGSINKVTLIGHLGKDPESRTFQNGGKVVNFSIATSETWKDKTSGERKEKTEWHNISVLNEGLAGVAERYLKKGSKVYVEGAMKTRKWQDQSGQDKYSTEVVLQGFNSVLVMLNGPNGGKSEGAPASQGTPRSTGGGGMQNTPSFSDDLDDSIPFASCDPFDDQPRNSRMRII